MGIILLKLSKILTEASKPLILMIVTYSAGAAGNYLRNLYYRRKLKSLGRNCIIDQGVTLHTPKKISIGDYTWIDKNVIILGGNGVEIGRRVHIAHNCLIQGGGFVKIEDYVGIAAGSMIFSATDTVYNRKRIGPMIPPVYRNPVFKKTVIIKKDAFIGARCIILPGARIGEGAVVGAGSLVVDNIPAWKIAVGTPAKPIKDRPKITAPDI